MKLSDLREAARVEYLDDVAQPQLWSDDSIDRFINEACIEAAIRSRIVTDTIEVVLTAGQGRYPLPGSTLDVTRCKLPGVLPLPRTTPTDLDESGQWEDRSGRPLSYAFMSAQYGGDGELLVYPVPEEAATATLAIVRLPQTLTSDSHVPEIPEHLHAHLLDWVAYRAFSLRDSDANDESRAMKHSAQFDNRFGRRIAAKAMPGRANRRRHSTKINSDWS